MSEKLVIIWNNFGPYHMARVRAMKPFFDVTAIELASDQRKYRWWRGEPDALVHTLTSGDWEDQNRLLVALKLWRRLNVLRPSVILVPGYASLSALCSALWGRTHAAKTILMSESNVEDRPRQFIVENFKRILVTLLFSGGIVGGKRAASYLQRLGMPAHKIAKGYDVVDNDFYSSRAAKYRHEAGNLENGKKTPYFLYVGRLAPEKNLSTLLQAFGEYRKSGGTWPLVIVGDGSLRDSLREQAQAYLQSEAVVFTGHKNVQELPQIYAFGGCFVLPSLSEPWGLVVNEAMASSLPVIVSSRCGCADDLVDDGSNGFVIDPCSASSIAAALTRMSELSREDRDEMAKRSNAIIAGYSVEHWASEVRRIVTVVREDNRINA